MYLCTHWSRRLNSKLLTYRYRDLHDGGCLPAFSLIIHPKKAIFLYISILPFHEPSSPVWTPCLCIFSSSCLNHLVLKTAQGIIHSDKATLILPVTGCFPFFHSTTFSLSPQSDYKCLEGRDHVFPNPSTVSNTKRYICIQLFQCYSHCWLGLLARFQLQHPSSQSPTLEFFMCFSPFLYLSPKSQV